MGANTKRRNRPPVLPLVPMTNAICGSCGHSHCGYSCENGARLRQARRRHPPKWWDRFHGTSLCWSCGGLGMANDHYLEWSKAETGSVDATCPACKGKGWVRG